MSSALFLLFMCFFSFICLFFYVIGKSRSQRRFIFLFPAGNRKRPWPFAGQKEPNSYSGMILLLPGGICKGFFWEKRKKATKKATVFVAF